MNILKQTSSELVLNHRPSVGTRLFMVVWSLGFVGIPLLMLGGLAYGLGITRLSCRRLEVQQVRCDRQTSNLMGLVKQPPETFLQVTAARTKSKREWVDDSENGRQLHVDNWVVLDTERGEVTILEDAVRVNGTRGSESDMQQIANEIDSFLRSDRQSLDIVRDLRFRLGQSLLPIAFISIFPIVGGAVIFSVFASETWQFDGIKRQLVRDRQTLLGTRTWKLPFHRIRDVTLNTNTGSDGDTTYQVELVLDRDGNKTTPSTSNRHAAEVARDAIRTFLRLR
ncbi:MAG: hypothetical protein AAFX40_19275 [Cyanobacteria bacterium J06639_1]